MAEDTATSVSAAFEILLEEIESEVELMNNVGARAFRSGDYELVSEMAKRAKQITDLRNRVDDLQSEWESLNGELVAEEIDEEARSARRQNYGRLQAGVRTPGRAFYRPVLSAIAKHGGSAPVRVILQEVRQQMDDQLKGVDFEPLPSDTDRVRWESTAHWARQKMIRSGYLKDGSPRGIWEITDQGRKWLVGQENR